MRVLGVDHGDRHIGLALSDPLLITAQPLGTYEPTGRPDADAEYFRGLVAKHDVGEIVVGHPLLMDGSPGSRADKTRAFAAWLERTVGRPVALLDERLTTRQALRALDGERVRDRKKKKDREDRIAAVIILSTYLERRRGADDGPEAG